MAEKSNAQKLQIKAPRSVLVLHGPGEVAGLLGAIPAGVTMQKGPGPKGADIVVLFVEDRKDMEARLAKAKAFVAPGGFVWLCYHKGTSKTKTDINRDSIFEYAQTVGLQAVSQIALNDDWSALRLKPQ